MWLCWFKRHSPFRLKFIELLSWKQLFRLRRKMIWTSIVLFKNRFFHEKWFYENFVCWFEWKFVDDWWFENLFVFDVWKFDFNSWVLVFEKSFCGFCWDISFRVRAGFFLFSTIFWKEVWIDLDFFGSDVLFSKPFNFLRDLIVCQKISFLHVSLKHHFLLKFYQFVP